MHSLRRIVALLGGFAGMIGAAMALSGADWARLTPDIPPDDPLAAAPVVSVLAPDLARLFALGGAALCLIGAGAIWRAPRRAGLVGPDALAWVALSVGVLGLIKGLGYTPFTLLPIGFALVVAGLAVIIVLGGEG